MAIEYACSLFACCPTCGMRYRRDPRWGDPNRVPEHFDPRTDCEIVPSVCWGSGLMLNPRTVVPASLPLEAPAIPALNRVVPSHPTRDYP